LGSNEPAKKWPFDTTLLALWGDRDRLVPLAHRDGVMTAFPHAQISVWKKMGHHPQRERPSELAQFVEAACSRPCPSEHVTGRERQRKSVPAATVTPQLPTATDANEFPAVA
jgi:hypothetical protein